MHTNYQGLAEREVEDLIRQQAIFAAVIRVLNIHIVECKIFSSFVLKKR